MESGYGWKRGERSRGAIKFKVWAQGLIRHKSGNKAAEGLQGI